MQELKFYDLKTKKAFMSSSYKVEIKKGKRFAVTTAPSGIKSYRIIGGK